MPNLRLAAGGHLSALIATRQEELALASAWARACGDTRGLYLTGSPDAPGLRAALPDPVRIVALPAPFDAARMLAWWSAELAAARREGFAGIHVCAVFASEVPHDELLAYERRLTAFLAGASSSATCVYDRGLSAALVRDSLTAHPHVVIGDHVCACPHFVPAAVAEREVEYLVERMVAEETARQHRRAWARTRLAHAEARERRLARTLHDELGQSLAAIALGHDDITHVIGQALETVRAIAGELRPSVLDDLGLVAAVRSLARRHALRTGAEVALDLALDDRGLDGELATACYRIIEAAIEDVDAIALRGDPGVELELRGPISVAGMLEIAQRVELVDGELARDGATTRIRVRR